MIKTSAYLSAEEINSIKHHVVLYGAGTQSTGMILMALQGDYKWKPDFAVFSDTGAEPRSVIEYKEYFAEYVKKEFDFDIYTVSRGNLQKDTIDYLDGNRKRVASIPLFTETGMLWRQCTEDYKIDPANKFVKKYLGIKRKNDFQNKNVAYWKGISVDEMQRMNKSDLWWNSFVFPLIENRMRREDTIRYVLNHGLKLPPRSACKFCPFHSSSYWKHLHDNEPEEFQEAVEFDEAIRNHPKLKQKCYVHKDLIPLKDINFNQIDLMKEIEMIEECGGNCGV